MKLYDDKKIWVSFCLRLITDISDLDCVYVHKGNDILLHSQSPQIKDRSLKNKSNKAYMAVMQSYIKQDIPVPPYVSLIALAKTYTISLTQSHILAPDPSDILIPTV